MRARNWIEQFRFDYLYNLIFSLLSYIFNQQILNSKTSTLKGFRIKDESDWSSLKCLMEFLHLREIPSEILRGSFILFQNMICT